MGLAKWVEGRIAPWRNFEKRSSCDSFYRSTRQWCDRHQFLTILKEVSKEFGLIEGDTQLKRREDKQMVQTRQTDFIRPSTLAAAMLLSVLLFAINAEAQKVERITMAGGPRPGFSASSRRV